MTIRTIAIALVAFVLGAAAGYRYHDPLSRMDLLSAIGSDPVKDGEEVGSAHLVTADQVKGYWQSQINRLMEPSPNALDKDYHVRLAEWQAARQLVDDTFAAGRYDHLAEQRALEWNLEEARRTGDRARARKFETELEEAKANPTRLPVSLTGFQTRMQDLPLDLEHPAFR